MCMTPHCTVLKRQVAKNVMPSVLTIVDCFNKTLPLTTALGSYKSVSNSFLAYLFLFPTSLQSRFIFYSISVSTLGKRHFFQTGFSFADDILAQLSNRAEYAHLFAANNESSKKAIWKCLLEPDVQSREHRGGPFHNPICSIPVWETRIRCIEDLMRNYFAVGGSCSREKLSRQLACLSYNPVN